MTQDIQEEEAGKLFVGGLSWETSKEKLYEYFACYGEIIECIVMKNAETGRSRGFGFVTFKDAECVQLVLNSGPHQLDNRTIDPKSCNPKSVQKSRKEIKMANYPKIFLGGLPSDVNETVLKQFFSDYGKVVEVVIMYDQERKKHGGSGFRGFGFLSFESEEAVNKVVAEHYVIISGKKVEVKRAEPREKILNENKNGSSSGANENSNDYSLIDSQWSYPSNLITTTSVANVNQVSLGPSMPLTNGIIQPLPYSVWNSGWPTQPPPHPPTPQAIISPSNTVTSSTRLTGPPPTLQAPIIHQPPMAIYVKPPDQTGNVSSPPAALPNTITLSTDTSTPNFPQQNGWQTSVHSLYPNYPTWTVSPYPFPVLSSQPPAPPPPPAAQVWTNTPYVYGSTYSIGYTPPSTVPINQCPPTAISIPAPIQVNIPAQVSTISKSVTANQSSSGQAISSSSSNSIDQGVSQVQDSNNSNNDSHRQHEREFCKNTYKCGPSRVYGSIQTNIKIPTEQQQTESSLSPNTHHSGQLSSGSSSSFRASSSQSFHPYRRATSHP